MSRPGRAGALLLVLGLGALLYLPGLGREILRHPLEAKYALAAREMLTGGPRLVAHLFGRIYPDKPPLYFWATAGLAWVRGGRLDETTARLPAVLGALATLALTWALGRALFGTGTGLASAAILGTSNLFFWYARQGHPDQFLTAAVTLAGLGLWRSFGTAPGWRRTGWLALAYAGMGLGVLSKGLLALVLPLLAGALYLGVTGPLAALPGRLGLWPGVPAFLVVVLAWFGPAVARHGIGYLYETIVHQHLERYARTWVHAGPWYYYFGEFAAGFLPWSLFVPGALVLAWRTRRAGAAAETGAPRAPLVFPLAWFVAGFVFLSLSTSKRGAYLLPLYPAAALAVGWLWAHAVATETRPAWLGVPVGLLAGVAAALALVVLVVPGGLLPGNMVDTLLPTGTVARVGLAAMLLAGAAAVWTTWRRGRPGATLAAIVAVQCLCLHAVAHVRVPQYEARFPARELAARVAALVPPGEPVLSLLADYDFLVAFYLDRRLAPMPGPSELLAAATRRPCYALLDNDDRALLGHPAVRILGEGRLGPKRIVLVHVDARPRPPPA